MIKDSWKRCEMYGLKPSDFIDSIVLDHKQILGVLKKNQELTHFAIPVLEKLYPVFKEMGHIVSVVDRHGTIIYTLGNENLAREVQMQVGANWLENTRGTNAMGVALHEKSPIRVHGNQHFIESAQFLTCAASPIFLASGEVIGAINISGKIEKYHPYTFSLTQLIADDIGNRISLQHSEKEHRLTLQELEFSINKYVTVPFLSLDNENRIIRANNRAKTILGQENIGQKLNDNDQFIIETITSSCRKFSRSIAIHQKKNDEKRLHTFSDVKGACPRVVRVKKLAEKAAITDIPILLSGETGTGKELFAQSIHSSSLRSHSPFIAVNCGAISESLIESELFGYIGGSFTGANQEGRKGKFEAAQNGTLFLDEIGDMSLRAQVTLLRALQEKEITPVGSTTSKGIDVRIIAATNKDLLEEVKENRFRADLYYRIKGIQITLPSLRKRSDLIQLAIGLLEEKGYSNLTLSEEAKQKVLLHTWPGNIRELMSVLVEASFLSEGKVIRSEDIQIETDYTSIESNDGIEPLKSAEKLVIEKYIRIAEGNISVAAERLQISRNTLYRKIKEYNIEF
ncbi:sigma-54-dependent Fis family transcriptional regulator [Sporosarcina sp. G11-34]|uniref:sigma-54-dependent Fis family transcriptional regulator n=1 Tax=Sporosarcina sp. G11-34 TaxID=2849605 RepID=UPI0022A9D8B9|nr:sigma-54-dependent Fis family transcriptional regulator [Sporosarcina sp. G11-34]